MRLRVGPTNRPNCGRLWMIVTKQVQDDVSDSVPDGNPNVRSHVYRVCVRWAPRVHSQFSTIRLLHGIFAPFASSVQRQYVLVWKGTVWKV